MIRQDYILRLIEQLAIVVAHILRLKSRRQHDDAMMAINQAMMKLTGLNSVLVNTLVDDSLLSMLKAGAALDVGKAVVLAELLSHEADILEDQGATDESRVRYAKALTLYLEALAEEPELEMDNIHGRIQVLVEILGIDAIGLPRQRRLFAYYERVGRYAAAEDLLYEMLACDATPDVVALGVEFYERLLERDDAELLAGDLPRDETEQGLAELKRRQAGS